MKNNSLLFRIKVGVATLYSHYVKILDRTRFGFIADDVALTPPLILSHPENVFLYGDNGLNNATIYADSAKFIMKKHSGAAEGLRVSTANHAMILGRFYRTIKQSEKPKIKLDDIIIESDVWIGRNVTILSGVHIGRGCTVGAGAVVSKSLPPYCVAVGVPAKPIKFKWSIEEILQHEQQLYDPNERFTREELEEIFAKYKK